MVPIIFDLSFLRFPKMFDKKDLYKFLSGGKPEQGTITNVMAWFALEEVNRMFED